MAAITERPCGTAITFTQVSRATAQLDEVLEVWRNRPLGQFPYLYLDARYEKVRQDGQVRDAAVLLAAGVDEHGKRHILGVLVSLSEQEILWRTFLHDLMAQLVRKYAPKAARLAEWMKTNLPEGLTVVSFPAAHRRRIRTTNGLERVSKEIRRILGWWASSFLLAAGQRLGDGNQRRMGDQATIVDF